MASVVILYSVSFISIAESLSSKQKSDPEKLSFYGGRVVPHTSADTAQLQIAPSSNKTSTQRRAIYPSNVNNIESADNLASTKSADNSASTKSTDNSASTKSADNKNTTITWQEKTPQTSITLSSKPLIKNETTVTIGNNPKGIITQPDTITPIVKSLTREDLLLAKKAHYYIDRNWNKNTGLIDSVQGYHHTTLWDVASGIGAILALENLKLISRFDATARLKKTLTTLFKLPLYNNELPNREYNTESGLPSGPLSNTATNGNGWSALDIGRLLIWLEITKQYKPEFEPLINLITDKWKLERTVYNHSLYGELKTKYSTSYRQEGRLGYLQYAAQGYQFSGFDVSTAFKSNNTTEIIQNGIKLYIDQRNLPFFTSDSYVLQAIELGTPVVWWNQLASIYTLHKKQFKETKVLRIFAEDAMSRTPWFSYNNINIYGQPWLSTNTRGKPINNPQIFSNKVSFAFSVLFDDKFSQQLATTVLNNSLSQRSIPTGLYQDKSANIAYNINTNSLILVALWFKSRNNRPIYQPVIKPIIKPLS